MKKYMIMDMKFPEMWPYIYWSYNNLIGNILKDNSECSDYYELEIPVLYKYENGNIHESYKFRKSYAREIFTLIEIY